MGNMTTLNIASSALMAHRMVMDVIGQNIANANSPGYTRRVAHLAATHVRHNRFGTVGTGVTVATIERKRALFLEGRLRSEQAGVGEFDSRATTLTRIEGMLNEPSDSGISTLIDGFFAGWSALANDPTEAGIKHDLVGKADQLAHAIQNLYGDLEAEHRTADQELVLLTGQVNERLAEVAELNRQIREIEIQGPEAMALRDQRQVLLEELSELAPIRVTEDENGVVGIQLAGRTVVDGSLVRSLETVARVENGRQVHEVRIEGGVSAIRLDGGRLGALQTLRDHTIPDYMQKLDTLAARLIEEVNTIHRQGQGGIDFFAGTDASDIAVSTMLQNDPSRVETTTAGSTDDNDLARMMADLETQNLAGLGGRTFAAFHRDFVVGIGSDTAGASFGREAREASLSQVLTQIEQVEGVSLDEEMANMIAAEHAYEAAARVMSTASQMLETLLAIG